MSSATTQGIRVSVDTQYLPMHSDPDSERYVFSYTILIENVGTQPARLETRHWLITDAVGVVEEVKGPGVVGETPHLSPGEQFRYTSGCALKTPRGTMHGTYQMVRDDGDEFDAEIAPFLLTAPVPESERFLN